MIRRLRLPALVLAGCAAAAIAVGLDEAVPPPKGWIGTTEQWARGLGIGFAVLNLVLLAWLFVSVRRAGGLMTSVSKMLMFLSVAILPVAVVFFGFAYGMKASEKVEACGACHVMDPWVNNLRDPSSTTLASLHYQNRYIQENHCYTCHTDYGMFGSFKGKLEGLGHIIHYTTGVYPVPIKIASPYPNWRCLGCHGASKKFLDPEKHAKEDLPDLMSGKTSCLDCHGPAHPPQAVEKKASR